MTTINTHGQTFIVGKVNTSGGKFIKRDKDISESDLEDIIELDDGPEIEEEDFDFDLEEFAETDLTKLPPNVNLGGGKYIPGNVNTKGRDFVGGKRK